MTIDVDFWIVLIYEKSLVWDTLLFSVCLSVCLSVSLNLFLFIFLFIYLSIYLSVYLSVPHLSPFMIHLIESKCKYLIYIVLISYSPNFLCFYFSPVLDLKTLISEAACRDFVSPSSTINSPSVPMDSNRSLHNNICQHTIMQGRIESDTES